MLQEALEDLPATLEYLVFGPEALEDIDRDAALMQVIGRMIPVINEGVILVAEEIDALKALIAARDDKPDAG
jgi:hypothetical protein